MADFVARATGKLSDRQILSFIKELAGVAQPIVDAPSFRSGGISFRQDEIAEVLVDDETYAIENASISVFSGAFVVFYARNRSKMGSTNFDTNQREFSPYFDEFAYQANTNSSAPIKPEIGMSIAIERIVAKHLIFKVPEEVSGRGDSAINLLQAEMAALASLYRKMTRDATEARKVADEELKEKKAAIESQLASEREAISLRRQEDENSIAALREDLEQSRKALDDRNHMHVRRELREKITQQIEKRVSGSLLPAGSLWLNSLIVSLIAACASVAGYFSYLNFEILRSSIDVSKGQLSGSIPSFDWIMWVTLGRGSISAIVSLGFIAYLVGWLRKTYLDNVRASNELQRYALDINRASWAIETIMEMTEKEGSSLPDKWIEGACYGLFHSKSDEKGDASPLEALGAILGVAARAEFGPNGPKIELERGQLKKLAPKPESSKN